jgi:hypothetical protein
MQGCKLLSDIGQCPTKFGKCPSKSNLDRTLVRSQKKIVTYIFCCDKIRCKFTNLHFAIKFTRHSSILLNVAPEWLYILVSWLIYILWRIYDRPNLVNGLKTKYKQAFAGRDATSWKIYSTKENFDVSSEGPSSSNSTLRSEHRNSNYFFAGSCIPTNESTELVYRCMYHRIPRYHRIPVLFISYIKFEGNML